MASPDLPVPPPFMWDCQRCTQLLLTLPVARVLSSHADLHDGSARCQLMLASHLAHEHPDEIPDPHQDDCLRCAFFAKQPPERGIDDLWAEHRARGLFLPADDARRL